MVFASVEFLFLFLPACWLLHALTPGVAGRNAVLLATSLLFYAWCEGAYLLLMLASIGVSWGAGLLVARGGGVARAGVLLAVAWNLGWLVVLKYSEFLGGNLDALLVHLGGQPALQIPALHLPVGISFFSFQALSYVLDVQRGQAPAQRDPLRVGLYVTLFPQLVAGPIVRYLELATQLSSRRTDPADLAAGARRFVVGLAKKVLVADVLAGPADQIFSLPAGQLDAQLAWLAATCYALQIYYDFSGYSDMALGLGRMFGFTFPENFLHPYAAASITEFWRRWHVTLSTWFRDYLYVPLGGNRGGAWRTYRNLVLVFLLCGLWHGAAWTFVAWGAWHGALLVLERLGGARVLARLSPPLRHAWVLLAVLVGWVLFRADSLPHAGELLRAMAGLGGEGLPVRRFVGGLELAAWLAGAIAAAPLLGPLSARLARAADDDWRWRAAFEVARGAALLILCLACASELAAETHRPFIYFRF